MPTDLDPTVENTCDPTRLPRPYRHGDDRSHDHPAAERRGPRQEGACNLGHTAAPIAPAANGDVTRAQMLAQVKQVFNLADTNHDGFMSRAEFAARMGVVINRLPPDSSAAPTKEQAQKMLDAANNAFNAVDTNHDGKLSLTEASARPLAAFDAMDANHDGILTLAEKQAARDAQAAAQGGPIGSRPSSRPRCPDTEAGPSDGALWGLKGGSDRLAAVVCIRCTGSRSARARGGAAAAGLASTPPAC